MKKENHHGVHAFTISSSSSSFRQLPAVSLLRTKYKRKSSSYTSSTLHAAPRKQKQQNSFSGGFGGVGLGLPNPTAKPHIDIGVPRVNKNKNQSMIVPYTKPEESTTTTQIIPKSNDEMWSYILNPDILHGTSLKTYSFEGKIKRAEIYLKNQGRPLDAEVELWQGPNNTPTRIKVHLEDGGLRSFRAMFELPSKDSHSIAVRNIGEVQSPFLSGVYVDPSDIYTSQYDSDVSLMNPKGPTKGPSYALSQISKPTFIQGGAILTSKFKPNVDSVQIMLKSNGFALYARVELFQGPESDKHVMDVYMDDGNYRPFYAIVETPGAGNVVRVTNTGTMEFPIWASVESYLESEEKGTTWSD